MSHFSFFLLISTSVPYSIIILSPLRPFSVIHPQSYYYEAQPEHAKHHLLNDEIRRPLLSIPSPQYAIVLNIGDTLPTSAEESTTVITPFLT